jgi:molybdate transport system ATP-binding protein
VSRGRPGVPGPPGHPALAADIVVRRGGFTLRAAVGAGPGEVVAVLGPNGAGKTTLLRALAGLVPIESGRIAVGGRVLAEPAAGIAVPVAERGVGVVFQDYRLFPHLSVLDNVAFAATARGARARQARRTAQPWLARLGLSELAGRRPGQLSGGQAQRVALARALASGPAMLLLDEPLAALDARTRLQVRGELRAHLAAFGGPSLVVTHDPLEALVLADRIVVLEHGSVVQQGTPAAVARRPATGYVARLMGLNLYRGTLTDAGTGTVVLDGGGVLRAAGHLAAGPGSGVPGSGLDGSGPDGRSAPAVPGARMIVVLAPSAIALHVRRPIGSSPRNLWQGTVSGLELLTDRVRVAVDAHPPALVDITPAAVADLHLVAGSAVWLSAKATEVVAYPEPTSVSEAG